MATLINLETFYKIAKPDGWDFYTGKTINYRRNIDKEVKCPRFDKKGQLCSEAFIHASRKPNQCFIGGSIPCSIYLVKGKPIKEDEDKCGFQKLFIEKELNPEEIFKWNYKEACNPVNPFEIKPPKKITKKHLDLLQQWDSVWASVWDSVWAPVGDYLWASVRTSVGDYVWASIGDSVRASIGDSVWASVGDSVRTSVGDYVWASIGDSVWAYIGSLFIPCAKKWKYIKHRKGEYPFQPAVDLWKLGLVPSFDGETWRLHGGKKGAVLWQL